MPKTTIVTAIPYVNSNPHIGNILTTLSGDVSARYHKMRGEDVFLVAGADENGLKIKEAAEAAGKDVHAFVEEISARFLKIFAGMGIEYDEFIHTSGERHAHTVQAFIRKLQENGHIYTSTYEGWYDVSTETYFREAELVDGKSPDGNEVRKVSEENYFFRLSAFTQPLLDYIEANPEFIIPESRKNEVVSFLKQGLRDMAISRRNIGWGVPWPEDESQVVYVWFDALINYVTACNWPDEGWEEKWPAVAQWLGKDILTRFHATLWPAMLMGAGLPLPKHVVAHAWILFGGDKMSKSRGNVVLPLELTQEIAERSGCAPEVGVDVVRWYLCSTMGYESDTIYTPDTFDAKYNGDLANDLGNALNRSLVMTKRFGDGTVPAGDVEPEPAAAIEAAKNAYAEAMSHWRLEQAAGAAIGLVRYLNKYIDDRAPWALAKANDSSLGSVLVSMLTVLRAAEGLFAPYAPNAAKEIASQLGLDPITRWEQIGQAVRIGTTLGDPKPIFPRLDTKAKKADTPQPKFPKPVSETQTSATTSPVANSATTAPATSAPAASPASELITIDDFAKVQLRVARIVEAEPLEGSDKLLKLQVRIGEEARQIVAGIRSAYTPEDLIGRQVVVVYNLKPAKLRGAESQGMLLAATDDASNAILLEPDREAPEGAKVR